MAYDKYHAVWKDYPDLSTPVDAAALEHMEAGIAAAVAAAEGASASDTAVEAIVSDTSSATYAALNSTFGVTASDTPSAPADGQARTYWVTSAVTWPSGIVWSDEPDAGAAPTITSAALVSLYTVDGTTYGVAGSTFTVAAAPDTTAPTAGTLAGSGETATGFTLTITGASDETALHATPYAFSTDNGANWTAFQSSASYAAAGLTPSTGYTCIGRVRDAAGNTADTAAVVVTTSAAVTTTYADDFSGTTGELNGRTLPTGGGTWASTPGKYAINATNELKVGSAGSGIATFTPPTGDQSTFNVQVSTWHSSGGARPALVFRYIDASNFYYAQVDGTGQKIWVYRVQSGTHTSLGSWAQTLATFTPTTLRVEVSGTSGTVKWGGATLGTFTLGAFVATETQAGFRVDGNDSYFDNYVLELIS